MKANRLTPVLVLLMASLLVPACSEGEGGSDAGVAGVGDVSPVSPSPEPPGNQEQLTASWLGDFGAMVERRVIRVATTFSRTNYFLDAGQPRGAIYEGLMEFERSINRQLGSGKLEVEILIIPMRRDRLFSAVVEGSADLAAANLTITPERLELVDFSDPIYPGVKEVIVTGPSSPKLETLEDLAGQEVHVRRSSSFFTSLTLLSEELQATGRKPIRIRAAEEVLETEDLLELVSSGNLPLTVADSHIASFWAEVLDSLVVREDLALVEDRAIAWAFRQNSPELAKAVNGFVAQHKKGTLFGNVMLKRYLAQNDWVRNPLSEKERELFARYRGYFEQYAGKYDVDWVLAAAQAFQESGFDQSARSRAGAVGIMQIKPSTAADKNVGIPDITSAENNIHAGIKYLGFIRDRYFTDGPDARNQLLLALAAYNAGPARIRQFRKQAAEKGLNPDVWFREVEQVASRETVTYVSNIAKYYVTYRELLRRNEALDTVRP